MKGSCRFTLVLRGHPALVTGHFFENACSMVQQPQVAELVRAIIEKPSDSIPRLLRSTHISHHAIMTEHVTMRETFQIVHFA